MAAPESTVIDMQAGQAHANAMLAHVIIMHLSSMHCRALCCAFVLGVRTPSCTGPCKSCARARACTSGVLPGGGTRARVAREHVEFRFRICLHHDQAEGGLRSQTHGMACDVNISEYLGLRVCAHCTIVHN